MSETTQITSKVTELIADLCFAQRSADDLRGCAISAAER